MATIGAAVTEVTKRDFEAVARARRTTASKLSASLIRDFLMRESGSTSREDSHSLGLPMISSAASSLEPKSKQVFVRLEPHYYAELGRLAAERHWYRGTYMASLFYAHADQRPVFCNAEIGALRQVARHLSDMGRNLAYVAAISRTAPACEHLAESINFKLLETLVATEVSAVKNLVAANLRGWGVSDDRT